MMWSVKATPNKTNSSLSLSFIISKEVCLFEVIDDC